MVELKKAHAKQCDELCREILKANVEADRLHNELKSKGVNIPRHALFKDANSAQNSPYSYVIATFITFFFAVSGSRRMLYLRCGYFFLYRLNSTSPLYVIDVVVPWVEGGYVHHEWFVCSHYARIGSF